MPDNLLSPTNAQTNDAESTTFMFQRLLSGAFFIELVQVQSVSGEGPNLVADVLPLVTRTDHTGAMIQNSTIYNVPVFRPQRGSSAIIMNPVPGDIGMIAVCDRDNSVARANLKESVPGSGRTHSKSDALYLGGFLNQQPTQFIEFADDAINITSPNPININCQKASVTAPDGVDMDTPLLKVSGAIQAGGDITDNTDSQSSTMKQLREAYNDHDHVVKSVQGGSSDITSEKPDEQI